MGEEAEAEAGCSLTFKSVDGKGNALYASALYIGVVYIVAALTDTPL